MSSDSFSQDQRKPPQDQASAATAASLSHLDADGQARMVDVGDKPLTQRQATAEATVTMSSEAFTAMVSGQNKKGDVIAVARIAGIQAAKQTAQLIPLCHSLPLSQVDLGFELDQAKASVRITSLCKTVAGTGVEMEALTAASVAALTIYDMCKAVDKSIQISAIQLLDKRGGKSGHWRRDAADVNRGA